MTLNELLRITDMVDKERMNPFDTEVFVSVDGITRELEAGFSLSITENKIIFHAKESQ